MMERAASGPPFSFSALHRAVHKGSERAVVGLEAMDAFIALEDMGGDSAGVLTQQAARLFAGFFVRLGGQRLHMRNAENVGFDKADVGHGRLSKP